jgi:ubiquinone/menaquinone biosynthesis C-methylase UbiE
MPLYDTIGQGYAKTRPVDDRIVTALVAALALPAGATILDVGAGTGKYSQALADRGFSMIAVEPSEVMREQSLPHDGVRWVTAVAEGIPLPANSADGAFIVLALHHFSDRAQAFREITRVIEDGPLVIFTFEPSALNRFWLADYFPNLGREIRSSFSDLEDVAEEVQRLTSRKVSSVPFLLPRDLQDKFAAAAWATPENYLDPEVRNGISSFPLMRKEDVDEGLARLKADLTDGRWDAKYGALRSQDSYEAGYKFIIARKAD